MKKIRKNRIKAYVILFVTCILFYTLLPEIEWWREISCAFILFIGTGLYFEYYNKK